MLTKKQRFAKWFPRRINKVVDDLRILGNCSAKNNYEWDESKVKQCFGLLFRQFVKTAELYGLTVTAQVDGIEVRTLDS